MSAASHVAFTVPGRIPSKSNHRHANTAKSRRAWALIRQYEREVGMAAIAAGAGGPKRNGRGRVFVRVLLLNQRVDPDNAVKAALDGLKGVVMVDDSGDYVRGVQVVFERDDGPARVEYRISWEGPGEDAA